MSPLWPVPVGYHTPPNGEVGIDWGCKRSGELTADLTNCVADAKAPHCQGNWQAQTKTRMGEDQLQFKECPVNRSVNYGHETKAAVLRKTASSHNEPNTSERIRWDIWWDHLVAGYKEPPEKGLVCRKCA